MSEQALRVEAMRGVDVNRICYWKHSELGWFIYLPGAGAGRLALHKVEEHEDGTITVDPSILCFAHADKKRHGYLKRGTWEPCGDDCKP